MGFTQPTSDPCIYMDAGGDVFYIGVYVDDIILARHTDKWIKEVKVALSQKFNIKDMGKLHYFLGMTVVQDEEQKSVWIGQPSYTESFLHEFGMQDCKPVSTPVDASSKLAIATDKDECVDRQVSVWYWKPDVPTCLRTLDRTYPMLLAT